VTPPSGEHVGGQIQPGKKGRPCKEFIVEVTVRAVPLPPEKEAAYYAAWREIGKLIRREDNA
jgi:hypothetical protein